MTPEIENKALAYATVFNQPDKRIGALKTVMDDLYAVGCMNRPITGAATLVDGSIDPLRLAEIAGQQKVVQHIEEMVRRATLKDE